jgi:holo-[acyl-carrier protein] synthase
MLGSRFERWFTPAERDYCRSKAHPEQHFAARLAAKEAVFKALGLSGHMEVPWNQIEIRSTPRAQPTVLLHGNLGEFAARRGVVVRVSLSHCDDYATATAMTLPAGT